MPLRPNEAARDLILDDDLDAFDGADFEFFDGTQPSAGGGAHSDNELAAGTLPTPAFAAAASGERGPASAWLAPVGVGITAQTIGWCRITQGAAIIDMDVGEGSGTLSLAETEVSEGETISVNAGAITLPGNDA
jgi:hypothetical protein